MSRTVLEPWLVTAVEQSKIRWSSDVKPVNALWRDSVQDWLAWVYPVERWEWRKEDTGLPQRDFVGWDTGRCIVKVLVPRANMPSESFSARAGIVAFNANQQSKRLFVNTDEVRAAHIAFLMGVVP